MSLSSLTVFFFFFFFFAFQLLQEHRPPTILRHSTTPPDLVPCSPLRSSSVSCFPAPSQLSSSMCSLVFLCLDNLEGFISEFFSLYCCQLSSLCAQSKSNPAEPCYTILYWLSLCLVHSLCLELFLCVLDLFANVSIVLYYMCVHVVLVQHGEMSLVRIWMTNHPPSVLWHYWLGHQTCQNIISEMSYRPTVWSGTLNITQPIFSVISEGSCVSSTL